MIQQLLHDVVLDHDNPFKLYALAKEYDKLEQGAGAATFYMRAAEWNDAETEEEIWVQYKSLILMALVYHREKNRDMTVRGLMMHAITVLPNRPEAYYIYSKWLADRHEWRDALMISTQGLNCADINELPKDSDLDYPGKWGLEFVYAISRWKTDGSDPSRNLIFDFKYKTKHTREYGEYIDTWLKQCGYPSTLPFTAEEKDTYKFPFPGIENIKRNYSRHYQDMFVLSTLNGKRDGTFIEVGSGDPYKFNNTALLEDEFGWTGINIDNNDRFCYQHSRKRKSQILQAEAQNIDYNLFFKMNCVEKHTDFLRINAEGASIEVLKKIPFDKYEFMVIQFQHNACWWGPQIRNESREILQRIGYVCMVPDVAVSPTENYEDWWVHPNVAQLRRNMKGKDGINFAYDYAVKG